LPITKQVRHASEFCSRPCASTKNLAFLSCLPPAVLPSILEYQRHLTSQLTFSRLAASHWHRTRILLKATLSSISRAIAEPKTILGSKPLSNEIRMAFSRSGMLLPTIIIPERKDRLPAHGPLLGCSSPNNVPSPRAARRANS